MRMNFKGTAAAVAILAGSAFATGAGAASVNINTVAGIWSSVAPADVFGLNGVGTSAINWGDGDPDQSGYSFAGLAPQVNVASPFTVGTFTHNNFVISAAPAVPTITGATLDVTVNGDVDGTPFSLFSQFVFDHNETPNVGPVGCCDDIVTLVSASFGSETINVGGQDLVFNITGFTSGLSFATQEGRANSTALLGEFTTRPNVIPLPAAGWLLIAGVGGLAALGRRKKA